MPNTYSWQFLTLECRNTEGGFSKVVKRVVGMYKADNGSGVVSSQLLNIGIGGLDPMSFTEFESLTASEVQGWVEDSMMPAALTGWQATLDARIEEQLLITPEPPPWVT
jgi:hypothetical protein